MADGELKAEVTLPQTMVELPGARSKSWGHLLFTFGVLIGLAGITGYLVQEFLQQRPVDLTGVTTELAREFQESLQRHEVPAENISSGQAEFQAFEDGGGWYFFPFQVTVPSGVQAEAVVEGVRRDMAARGVAVALEETPEEAPSLSLSLAGDQFAAALLQTESAPQRLDLRAASTRIANQLAEELQQAGGRVLLERGPEVNEDAAFAWTTSNFSVTFPQLPAINDLRATLEEAFPQSDVSVVVGEGGAETLRVEILLHGKTVAAARLHAEAKPAAPVSVVDEQLPPAETPLAPVEVTPLPAPPTTAPEAVMPPPLEPLAQAPVPAPEPEPVPVEPVQGEAAPGSEDATAAAVEDEHRLPPPHPDAIALPESVAPPAPQEMSEAIQQPDLPPQEDLPLESTVLEDQQLAPPDAEAGPFEAPSPAALKMPKLALIIDDGGYGGERTERLLELDPRLTLAILPNTPFARETAERALEKGFEIMLHMPMETYGSPFPGEIKTEMEAAEIERLTLDALSQVPGVEGINNHTGSKYTRDAAKMGEFLEVVKERDLFFIDSITITKSAAFAVAQSMEIPSAQRDIFIDNSSSPDLIRRQLREVIMRAKSKGTAIGIGHFRPNTVAVLEEELPKLEEYGVELVHASELVR